jgi:mRNA-degrading endonuclease RelE of RelBE toxin-antitoxin system
MSYNITATPNFKKELKRLLKKFQSLKVEYLNLLDELAQNPTLGSSLGNNIYKIRISIASKGKGKSGGARVITFVIKSEETIYLMDIYDKSEKANITDKEIKSQIEGLD